MFLVISYKQLRDSDFVSAKRSATYRVQILSEERFAQNNCFLNFALVKRILAILHAKKMLSAFVLTLLKAK